MPLKLLTEPLLGAAAQTSGGSPHDDAILIAVIAAVSALAGVVLSTAGGFVGAWLQRRSDRLRDRQSRQHEYAMSLRSDLRQVLARVLVSMNDVWIWCIDQHKSGTAPSHDLVAGHLRDLSTALREARLLVEDDDALEHTSKAVDDDLMALWQVMAAQGAASPALVRRLIDDFVDERARAEAEMRALLRPVANSG